MSTKKIPINHHAPLHGALTEVMARWQGFRKRSTTLLDKNGANDASVSLSAHPDAIC